MQSDKKKYWVMLNRIRGISPVTQRILVDRFNEFDEILNRSWEELAAVPNISLKAAKKLSSITENHLQSIESFILYLEEEGITAELVKGDMMEALKTQTGRFDVIIASFSLHHLVDAADKQAVFTHCAPLLSAAGILAVIDLFTHASESRDEYIERWVRHADDDYLALGAEEKRSVFDHVRACDFPVSLEQCKDLGKAAGLPNFKLLHEDANQLYGPVTLS